MKKTLFHINQTYLALAEILEEAGGELTPELENALQINKQDLSAKAENYMYLIEKMKQEEAMAKEHEERAKAFRKSKEKVRERLENAILQATLLHGSFTAGVHTVSLRKSEQVIITSEQELPTEFFTRKVVETPDKTRIKAELKAGKEIPGAELITNQNLQIK